MTDNVENGGDRFGRVLRVGPWVVATLLLLLPAVAMQFTEEVNWGPEDFGIIGVLLFGGCGLYELAARATRSVAHRLAVGVAIGGGFLLIWINLAVGIIGSEDNSANLFYAGVLGIGLVGAVFVGFKPAGMMRVLMAMSAATVAIGAVALVRGWGSEGENWPQVIVVLNGFFAAVWLLSAGMFRMAARERAAEGGAG